MKDFKRARRLSPGQMVALGFALVIALGTVLLSLPVSSQTGERVPVLDACFTATTATCVTGLVTVDTGDTWSLFGQCVILFLMQIGGLGFMTITTMMLMLMGKRITLRERLLIQESLNEDALQGLVALTRRIFVVAISIEFLGAVLLSFRMIPTFGWGKGIFYSIFHSVSAFCNAGLDLFGGFRSLIDYRDDVLVNFTIMILIVLGGLGFTVLLDLMKMVRREKTFSAISLHSKVVLAVTGILILSGWAFFLITEWDNVKTLGQPDMPVYSRLMGGLFQSVSTRTAGFTTLDQNALTISGKLGTMIYMFIGASPASTGGGMKTTTIAVLVMMLIAVIRGRQQISIFERRLEEGTVRRALAIVAISFMLVIVATMVLAVVEGESSNPMMSFENMLYEVISGFATVGLTTGITPELNSSCRLVLILIMFAGRVGPLTLLMALTHRMSSREDPRIAYPEGRIMVG